MSETDWLIIDGSRQAFWCTRCGAEEPLTAWMRVSSFLRISDAFVAQHRLCKDPGPDEFDSGPWMDALFVVANEMGVDYEFMRFILAWAEDLRAHEVKKP